VLPGFLPSVRRARAGAIAAVAAAVLAACGATGGSSASTSHARGSSKAESTLEGTMGGSATIALDQVPSTLNDHTLAGDNASTKAVDSAILPQVFQVGPGGTPVLDTSVVLSAELVGVDPQTVVYQINPRAVWSDGVPITVDDFTYAWGSQRGGTDDIDGSPDSVASTLGYRDIVSVTGSNNGRTVTVVFRTPFGDWASLFADLLPAHVAERVGWNDGFDAFDPAVLVSGGPWIVTSWTPGSEIVLGRNPHWWGEGPHLDRVVVNAAANSTNTTQALREGNMDVAYSSMFDSVDLAQLASLSELATSESLGTRMLQLVFNTRRAPLDDVDVRQGIAHAIDRAGVVTTLVQRLNSSIWEDNNHFFANVQPQYGDDGAGYVYADSATADRLLAQAGLVADPDGTWTDHGSPVTLELAWAVDDPWSALVEPALAAQLTEAGFDVNAVPVTEAQLTGSILPAGNFDLAIAPIDASTYPSQTSQYFTSSTAVTGPAQDENWSGFTDPRFDSLVTQAAQQLGSNLSGPLYHQADQQLWTDMSTLPLFAEPSLLVTSAWIGGVDQATGPLGPLFSADHWFRLVASHSKSSGS